MTTMLVLTVDVEERSAVCDFCSQANQSCYNSVNSSAERSRAGVDICKKCVRLLAIEQGMTLPVEGGETTAPAPTTT